MGVPFRSRVQFLTTSSVLPLALPSGASFFGAAFGAETLDRYGGHLVSILLVLDGDIHSLLEISESKSVFAFGNLCFVIRSKSHALLFFLHLPLDFDGLCHFINFFNRPTELSPPSAAFISLAFAGAAGAGVAAGFLRSGLWLAMTPDTKATNVNSATKRIIFFIQFHLLSFQFS